MSGVLDTNPLQCAVDPVCPLYDPNLFFASLFVLIDYFPTYVAAFLWGIAFYYWEFYFTYVGLVLVFDWGLNYGLKYAIGSSSRFPNCGEVHEMPSYSTEMTLLLVTMGICYAFLWNPDILLIKIATMNLIGLALVLARVYIGRNTIGELIIGALVGTIEGFFFSILLYLIRRQVARLMRWRFINDIGLVDTMCNLSKIN